MAHPSELPRIVIDTREQAPYRFAEYETIRKGIKSGDYSLEGYENHVAVERKSHADAYGCVGASRKRFEECLGRLSLLDRACVVIECGLSEFAVPPSRTRVDARMAVGSYISWSVKYRIPVYWCDTREYAERVTVRFLAGWMKHRSGLITPG